MHSCTSYVMLCVRVFLYLCSPACVLRGDCGHGGRHTHTRFDSEHNHLSTNSESIRVFHLCHRLSDFIRCAFDSIVSLSYASVSIALNEMERVISADIIIGIEEAIQPRCIGIYSFFSHSVSVLGPKNFWYHFTLLLLSDGGDSGDGGDGASPSPCNCIFQLCQ